MELKKIMNALEYCINKERENISIFGRLYPCPQSREYIYDGQTNYEWTNSFYSGMLWLAYEITKEDCFFNKAKEHSEDFRKRMDERADTLYTHDIGFLYTLSCVADYKITGDVKARETALRAADLLAERYSEKGGFIQAWGSLSDPNSYKLIIDCMLNIPLLFWASEESGNMKYKDMAASHLWRTVENAIRDDFTTHHTFYFDKETGKPLRGETHQGYSDDSCWARGQSWGIYGTALGYSYTKEESIIPIFNGLVDCFLKRLPNDNVPYWDMIFTSGDEPRDTSAAAITLCGILEMNKHVKNEKYMRAAERILNSLIDNYMTNSLPLSNGLLTDGMYGRMRGDRPECNIWGDYYFMEALVRVVTDNEWIKYW